MAKPPKPAPLTDEQVGIIQTKQITLTRPVSDLIGLLAPIAAADAAGEKSRARTGCLMAIAFIAGIVLLFVDTVPYHLILAVLFLLGGVSLIFVYRQEKAEDISDNLRKTAVPLLLALRDDFGSGPLEVKIDLRPPMAKEKRIGEQKIDKRTVTEYSDPWFALDGLLADGSRLRCSVTDTIIQQRYWKKGSSGKSKLKTKSKTKSDIDVDLTLRMKTYAAEEATAGEKKATLHAKAKSKRDGAEPPSPREVIDVIAGLYAQVRPAK